MLAVRRFTLSLVTLTVAFSGMATVAHADDAAVKAVIKHQDSVLKQSPQLKKLENGLNSTTPVQAPKAIKLINGVEPKLKQAANAVARASASTAQGKAGQRDWVTGVRDLMQGFSQLVTALKDIEHGNKAAAQQEALMAQKTLAAGNALGAKADSELKLPKGA